MVVPVAVAVVAVVLLFVAVVYFLCLLLLFFCLLFLVLVIIFAVAVIAIAAVDEMLLLPFLAVVLDVTFTFLLSWTSWTMSSCRQFG